MKRIIRRSRKGILQWWETRFPTPTEPRHVEVVHPADSRTLLTKEYVEAALSGKSHQGQGPQAIV